MAIFSSINKDQKVYVIRCGAGYSCQGFDYLHNQAHAVLTWLKEEGRAAEMVLGAQRIDVLSLEIPERKGTKKHFNACNKVIEAGSVYASHSRRQCPANLTPQLSGLVGRRVEVIDCYGERRRFIVGRSTGWMPCHLEIARRDSSGGGPVWGTPFKSVRVVA
ncbi:hypothetical protein JT354_gp09 [Serratia phage JS26]|uniref:Uncharacterized protein n=1 Tax=Serratia phage JS26 TaxID=2315217 RepID=A0A5Q2F9K5_9CAUD|nr:hypothetical protein JT354_gp09 [Serratia phage JS26]QGF20900.1 hypothetical protein [Serratia phage JS26]